MGVVHKLKQEVIDYILREKKNTPEISCRKLASLATEKFQTKISKSSINSVLKDANLSSKVGRRKGSRGKKKFQIPRQKKEQIFEQVRDLGFIEKNPFEDLPEKKERPSKELSEISRKIEKEFSGEKQEEALEAKILKSLQEKKERSAQKFSSSKRGAGWIFFKIAEWDLSPFLLLEGILSPYLNAAEQAPRELFNTQIFLNSYESLGKGHLEDMATLAVWDMDGFFGVEKSLSLREQIGSQELSLREQIQCDLALQQVFLKTSHVQILLEDGSELTLDPLLRTVFWGPVSTQKPSVFYKTCSLLSQRIMSNNEPAVLWVKAAGESWAEDVNRIISCFEGETGRKMEKAKIYDPFSKVLSEFSAIPKKKRNLILGLYQDSFQGSDIFSPKDVSLRTPFYSEVSDRIVYYSETIREIDTQEGVRLLRSIVLAKEKKENGTVVLVTNINEDPTERIIELFLKRFPDFDQERMAPVLEPRVPGEKPAIEDFSFLGTRILKGKSPNPLCLKDFFQEYSLRVFNYFKETYLNGKQRSMDFSAFQEILWEGKGGLSKKNDLFEVRLELNSLGILQKEIRPIIEKINNADVYTPMGHKVHLKI